MVFICFGVVSVTSPVLGVVVGGNIVTCLGGYQTKKSILLTLCFGSLAFVSAAPIPFIPNYPAFLVFLWLLMFFGGAILPSLTGIMLNTVQNNQKTTANSIAYLAFNVFGYLPSPFIYGAIADSNGGKNDQMALTFLMYCAAIPVISFAFATYFIFKEDVMGWKKQEQEAAANTELEMTADKSKGTPIK